MRLSRELPNEVLSKEEAKMAPQHVAGEEEDGEEEEEERKVVEISFREAEGAEGYLAEEEAVAVAEVATISGVVSEMDFCLWVRRWLAI